MIFLSGVSVLAMIIVSVTAVSGYHKPSDGELTISGRPSDLGLTVREEPGRLLISWNQGADEIRRAKRATLTISEAGRSEDIEIGADLLRHKRLAYSALTNDVTFRLTVRNVQPDTISTESVRFLTFHRP